MQLILGSQSPRRKEILSYFKLPFKQVKPDFDEESVVFKGDPIEYAKEICVGKAGSLLVEFPDDLIVTADTVVYKDGKVYAKPVDREDAYRMLGELQGATHGVVTAVSATRNGQMHVGHQITTVRFHALTHQQIRHYQDTFHTLDKAGGYGIQAGGSIIIEEIHGCFYNVMGLPLNALGEVLGKCGVDLWEHLG